MKTKSFRGCGKTFMIDYLNYLKWKRISYKNLKRLFKSITFDEFMEFVDWLIDNHKV